MRVGLWSAFLQKARPTLCLARVASFMSKTPYLTTQSTFCSWSLIAFQSHCFLESRLNVVFRKTAPRPCGSTCPRSDLLTPSRLRISGTFWLWVQDRPSSSPQKRNPLRELGLEAWVWSGFVDWDMLLIVFVTGWWYCPGVCLGDVRLSGQFCQSQMLKFAGSQSTWVLRRT